MIKLSNLDKVFWKKDKITKGDFIEYYAAVSPYILPYLKDRPLVMHRFPDGIDGKHFYQKEAGEKVPRFVKTASIQHEAKRISYIVAQNADTLLYVANLASIELHLFNSTIKHLEKPDYMVLDLDPEAIAFDAVVETANAVHELFEEAKIPHFCKTSGGDGLHIYIPLQGKYPYDQSRQFAEIVAHIIRDRLPHIVSLERLPKKRQKKVYIDCLQNIKGQLMVCPYSVRGRPHAPISTPLLWKEVKRGLDPLDFNLKTVPKRLSQKGDLFKAVLGKGINLQACLKRLEKIT